MPQILWIPIVPSAAAGDVPIRVGCVRHDGIDVGSDGTGDDLFISLQTLERREEVIRLGRSCRQRGDGEVARGREGLEGRRRSPTSRCLF